MARTTKTPHRVSRNKSGTSIVRASKLLTGRPNWTTQETAFETVQAGHLFLHALDHLVYGLLQLADDQWSSTAEDRDHDIPLELEFHADTSTGSIQALESTGDLGLDGLQNGDEVTIHDTDPVNTDTDGDGVNDGDEVNTHGSDLLDTDTDNDGLDDGVEVRLVFDPTLADTNGDGVSECDVGDAAAIDAYLGGRPGTIENVCPAYRGPYLP